MPMRSVAGQYSISELSGVRDLQSALENDRMIHPLVYSRSGTTVKVTTAINVVTKIHIAVPLGGSTKFGSTPSGGSSAGPFKILCSSSGDIGDEVEIMSGKREVRQQDQRLHQISTAERRRTK